MRGLYRAILIIILLSSLISIVNTPYVSAQTARDQFNSGLQKTAGGMGYSEGTPDAAQRTINQRVGRIIQGVTAVVGVFFLILMIYGGFTWMMARGNEQETVKAKNIIIHAMIGLIVVLAAFAITSLMMNFWNETADVGTGVHP